MADAVAYLLLFGMVVAPPPPSTLSQWLSYRKMKLGASRIAWIVMAVANKEIVADSLVNI